MLDVVETPGVVIIGRAFRVTVDEDDWRICDATMGSFEDGLEPEAANEGGVVADFWGLDNTLNPELRSSRSVTGIGRRSSGLFCVSLRISDKAENDALLDSVWRGLGDSVRSGGVMVCVDDGESGFDTSTKDGRELVDLDKLASLFDAELLR